MIISRDRKFTVRMGDFESYVFGAMVTVGPADLGLTEDDIRRMTPEERRAVNERLFELAEESLVDALVDEVREASTLTDNRRSFLLRALGAQEENPAPARAKSQRAKEPRAIRRIR